MKPTSPPRQSTVSEMPSLSETRDQTAFNLSLIQNEIVDTTNNIDIHQLTELVDRIRTAERVFLAGAGRSDLGLTVHVAGDTTTPAISNGDLLVVASGSGTTSGVVKAAQTALDAGAQLATLTTNPGSPLAAIANAIAIIPAAQKTDHGSKLSHQYSGSLFEQELFVAVETVFQTLWKSTDEPAEKLWQRHANLE